MESWKLKRWFGGYLLAEDRLVVLHWGTAERLQSPDTDEHLSHQPVIGIKLSQTQQKVSILYRYKTIYLYLCIMSTYCILLYSIEPNLPLNTGLPVSGMLHSATFLSLTKKLPLLRLAEYIYVLSSPFAGGRFRLKIRWGEKLLWGHSKGGCGKGENRRLFGAKFGVFRPPKPHAVHGKRWSSPKTIF